jgi:transcriptional regulator with XRE-family HTH domain
MDVAHELSQFLTSRRANVTPEQAGLPTYRRRRVPGLRREEVATLAGVSADYYKRLERGNTHDSRSQDALSLLASWTATPQEPATPRRGRAAGRTGTVSASHGQGRAPAGSGALTRWLLENDLVGEMNLLIVPVVVGQGIRVFPDNGPLDLVEARAIPKGVMIQAYPAAERPQYASAMAD